MNTKKHMIIIKDEIKTRDIVSCKYNPNTIKWDIVFRGSKRIFSYGYLNVEWLREPEILNPNSFRISGDGKELFNIQGIYIFRGNERTYWHICFDDDSERDYNQDELNISKSCLIDSESNNVFEYLTQISKLNDLKNESTGERILEGLYKKITYIDEKTVLARYLNPTKEIKSLKEGITPIFPFGCNKSQYRAVKNALENQLSVIQGPPGTGKTQTILNIIANILMQGKTVQIVSNNNAAIQNVYEKLSSSKYNLGFLVASLGNAYNKRTFIENQEINYPEFLNWFIQDEKLDFLEEVKKKSEQLGEVFDKQERVAYLKQELSKIELEQKYFEEYLSETGVSIDSIQIEKKISSKRLMELWQECQMLSENGKRLGFIFKLRSMFLYGISDWEFYKQKISKVITGFQGLFLKYKHMEIVEEINNIKGYLERINVNLLDDMCNQSLGILKDKLARRFENKKQRTIFSEEDLWKNSQAVLGEYPVVLSTTFSSRTSLNSNVEYDYLIMDEASQVDIATVHKFQGREKDTIIISTVDDEISDFTDDSYLLNVAVSRAKNKLILVVSGNEQSPERNISDLIEYIQYNNFEVGDSKIYSIFDYLYKQYTVARQKYLSIHRKVSKFDSENLMYGLISDILDESKYISLDVVCHLPLNMLIRNIELLNDRECEYVMNPATHLDFIIFNRVSKQPILVVEVDGYDFHKTGTTQSERDKMKNRILNLYDIPFLRFKTNGSGEKEAIEAKLSELVNVSVSDSQDGVYNNKS